MADPKPTRREMLKLLGGAAAGWALPRGAAARRPPNIVLILADDQGYADLGCYGARDFATPNLDRMAAEGLRFSSFYVSQAVCSASRASLLTGCYAERVGIQGALGPASRIGLSDGEETIAQVLKKRGYRAAAFGKWHLGHRPEFLPLRHGFDEYFGLPYSNDMWPRGYDGRPLRDGGKSGYPPLPLIDGERTVETIDSLAQMDQLTTRYTDRAVRFIEARRASPFFLYLAHSMPHTPLGVSYGFRGRSRQGLYGDVIMEIDASAGRIFEALRRLGLDENTLVIYASDNGPWLNFGAHAGSAGPLREGKGTMWEGGARVPCLMRWPGRIPAGIVSDRIAATIDILPTVAALTGAPLPGRSIDGVSLVPLLEGDSSAEPRDHYYFYYGRELQAVRKGRWKLHFPHVYRSYRGIEPGRDGLPGPYAQGRTGLELYDLAADIGESRDVAAAHPEVVRDLQELGEKARTELGDALTSRVGRSVRPPGRAAAGPEIRISHLAVGAALDLKSRFDPLYSGGGPKGLIDGRRGSADHQDPAWQGFEGTDLEAVIDLGRPVAIRRVAGGFLESQASWIFWPVSLSWLVSPDGRDWTLLAGQAGLPPEDRRAVRVRDFEADVPPSLQVRYIRLLARSVGRCPAWHAGAGGPAWLFADEIVAE
jgi:arylsulfatase